MRRLGCISIATLAFVCAASAQLPDGGARRGATLPRLKLGPNSFARPDTAPASISWPEGFAPVPLGQRAIQTVYDCGNTGTVYSYFPAGATGLGIAPNGGLEAVQLGPGWVSTVPLTQITICVRRMATSGSQTFKIFVRVWDTVTQSSPAGTDVKSNQLPAGAPLDLFYTNGGAGYTVTGQYTAGYALAFPPGMIPSDNNVAFEIRLVAASVTSVQEAALPFNVNPNMGLDCHSIQSLLGGTAVLPAPPSVGTGYPVDGSGHAWVDVDDATAIPPTAHDGRFNSGDRVSTVPPLGEEVLDTQGPTWANWYLRVLADALTCVTPIEITSQPTNQAVCAGGVAAFAVGATGNPITYQWHKQGAPIPGATQATLSIPSVGVAEVGSYFCVVVNGCGAVTSDSAQLTLNNPAFSVSPTSAAVCEGGAAQFSVTATGVPAPGYQWRHNGAEISGATEATISVFPANAANAGVYDCVATNSCGSATSAPATLQVNASPTINTPPQSQVVPVGQPILLTVSASGPGPLAYQWRRAGLALSNGGRISGATSSALTIAPAQAADSAIYSVVVGNPCGSTESVLVTVAVFCRVDLNANGLIEPADTALFVSIWFASLQQSTLTGDWDQNGQVQPSDIGSYVNDWFASLGGNCPP